jgi:hypothetical protein
MFPPPREEETMSPNTQSDPTTGQRNDFALYRKKGAHELRRYIPGEDLTHIAVSQGITPEEGGMIARNPDNGHLWYIPQKDFEEKYERAA